MDIAFVFESWYCIGFWILDEYQAGNVGLRVYIQRVAAAATRYDDWQRVCMSLPQSWPCFAYGLK
jgi:hypothetical protein